VSPTRATGDVTTTMWFEVEREPRNFQGGEDEVERGKI